MKYRDKNNPQITKNTAGILQNILSKNPLISNNQVVTLGKNNQIIESSENQKIISPTILVLFQ
ncbi:TPA: hypothetical protein DEG21_03860 [Patescibacteria group bacterium]|nr:hypothetical protein [Candidatus Gracilibacteria bacterium]HBY74986.1 hypothetical protein [Candidatus Gracilibacteria bacterium]